LERKYKTTVIVIFASVLVETSVYIRRQELRLDGYTATGKAARLVETCHAAWKLPVSEAVYLNQILRCASPVAD